MNEVTTIPQATKHLVKSINGASQRLHDVASKVAGIFGIEAPTAPVEASDLPQAMSGFIGGSLATADVFDAVASMFDGFLGEPEPEPVQIEAAPEPVQIEQSKPQEIEQASEPAPETLTIPAEVEGDPDPFCEKEKEDAVAEEREESNANESTEEPDFLPDGDPVNRMASYESEPSVNGRHAARGKRVKKGSK